MCGNVLEKWKKYIYTLFTGKNITEVSLNESDVTNAFVNYRSAIMSRIDYVEKNEPHRLFWKYFRNFFVFVELFNNYVFVMK